MIRTSRISLALLPLAGALALGACGEAEETTYETDVTDVSGGELIVTDADQPGVDVNLPETPMTPVAPGTEPEVVPTPE